MATLEWEPVLRELHPWCHRAVKHVGFTKPTPVQRHAIPPFCNHKDVLVEACTGSGKTLAFLIPIYHILLSLEDSLAKCETGAIIIAPTRELCLQIATVARQTFTDKIPSDSRSHPKKPDSNKWARKKHSEIDTDSDSELCRDKLPSVLLLTGGIRSHDEDRSLVGRQGANVVIATPGRLAHCIGTGILEVRRLEVLVLDEADRLLEMGFEHELNAIVGRLPRQRRTGLFSATLNSHAATGASQTGGPSAFVSDGLSALVRVGMRNPLRIELKVESKARSKRSGSVSKTGAKTQYTPNALINEYCVIHDGFEMVVLLNAVKHYMTERKADGSAFKVLIFVLTCAQVDYIRTVLRSLDVFAKHIRNLDDSSKRRIDSMIASKKGSKKLSKTALKKLKKKMKRKLLKQQQEVAHCLATEKTQSTDKKQLASGSAESSEEQFGIWFMHGRLRQEQRTAIYNEFSSLRTSASGGILICTDIVARGIDIPNVDLILQMDPPQQSELFIHRVGRTARNGQSGKALVLLRTQELDYLEYLRVKQVPISRNIHTAALCRKWHETIVPGTVEIVTGKKESPKKSRKSAGKSTEAIDNFLEEEEGESDVELLDSVCGLESKTESCLDDACDDLKDGALTGGIPDDAFSGIIGEDKGGDSEEVSARMKVVRSVFCEKIRSLARTDREIVNKSQRAFVSFLRGYSNHECRYIFRLDRLKSGLVAFGYGLLYFPTLKDMPVRHKELFVEDSLTRSDKQKLRAIPFKDSRLERERQKVNRRYENYKIQRETRKRQRQEMEAESSKADSCLKEGESFDSAERRKKRSRGKKAKSRLPKEGLLPPQKRRRKQRRSQFTQEFDSFQSEELLYRKLKKGLISQKQFDKHAFGF